MSYPDSVAADVRLHLLELLAGAAEYTGNEVSLQSQLSSAFGHSTSRDRMRTELTWLDEQGLITLQRPGGVYLATLTERGYDVSRGASQAPGIARPRPRF